MTHVRAERDVDSPELREPVPPSSRGVQDVVKAHFDDAVKIFAEEQPGQIRGTHRRAMQFGVGVNAWHISFAIVIVSFCGRPAAVVQEWTTHLGAPGVFS